MKDSFASCWVGDRLNPLANMCINSFGARGFPFILHTYNPVQDVPGFVEVRDAEALVARERIFRAHGGLETFCDLFGYSYLFEHGGWWVDLDVLCNCDAAPQVDIAFAEEMIGVINNAVMRFPKAHPAIRTLLDYVATVDPTKAPWGATGPLALTKVFTECGLGLPFAIRDFYPLYWNEAPKLLFPEFMDEVLEKIAPAPFVHLWGATFREVGFDLAVPPAGSYMETLYSRHLDPQVRARLQPLDEGAFRNSVKTYVEANWGIKLPIRT